MSHSQSQDDGSFYYYYHKQQPEHTQGAGKGQIPGGVRSGTADAWGWGEGIPPTRYWMLGGLTAQNHP